MLIKMEHMKKSFENVTPLKDVNFEVNKGDVIAIIGPSGTGKSTLINCINKLEEVTSGKVYVDGIDVTDKKTNVSELRKKVGMVFQSFNLFSHLTIIENIMLAPRKIYKKNEKELYEEAMNLLSQVGLKDKALSYPKELSGGQQQRVAIVRALAMHPEIILFDEPTSALDPTMIGEVLAVIKKLAKDGLTMIIVTHEMKFAKDVATRIFYMDEGIVYEEGTPEEIFEHPKKDKTRQFIERLKVCTCHIDKKNFNYPEIVTSIEQFSYKNMISGIVSNKLNILFEEICMNGIKPKMNDSDNINISIEYSDDKNTLSMNIDYSGEKYNAVDLLDDISKKLVENISKDINYSYDNENKLKIGVTL